MSSSSSAYGEVRGLSDKRKALFKRLQKEASTRLTQQQRAGSAGWPTIPRRSDLSVYPLAFSQERFWRLEQLSAGNPALQVTCALHLNGSVDVAALQQALRELVQRHEILRAVFANQNGTPVQLIRPMENVDLARLDLSGQEDKRAQLLAADQPHTFDITSGPLFKVTLARLAEAEYLLVFSLHVLLADYPSLVLLCQELLTLYSQIVTGQRADLPALTLCYADYAAWQRQYLQGEVLETHQAYWQRQLADAVLSFNLPFDTPRPAGQVSRQVHATFTVDRQLVQQTQTFCAQEGLELHELLYAAFALLLSKYTGQADILAGFLSTARSPELEPLVGRFSDLLPLRVQLGEEMTGQSLLLQVQQTLLAASNHRALPFAQRVAAAYPGHDLTRVPFLQTSLAFYRYPSFQALPPNLIAHYMPTASPLALQDLALQFHVDEQDLHLTVVYNSELFAAPRMTRFQQHYCQLLSSLIEHSTEPLSQLSCLTSEERACMLHSWNAATLDTLPAPEQCIQHLFEAQVRRTPRAIALSDSDLHLTYEQLNSRANQLAHLLLRQGIGPENLVGLCLPRSFDLVVGLLAILKTGAAYVPLDLAYPRERLLFTVRDARLSLVITTSEFVSQLALPEELALCLDIPDLTSTEDSANLTREMNHEQLAYVIYTSGSTGQPKGVCVSHRSAVIFLTWARQHFSDEELAGVLFGTSICFDLSIFELFAPLSWGGKVILASTVLDLPFLATKERITLLNTVPSAAAALLASAVLPADVRTVNLAGEALTRDLVQALYRQPGVRRVCNLYGPTEDTTYSTWIALDAREQGGVPIGRPLANTQAYIVDRSLHLVPPGIVGELYLGGDGQARGYLNRPDLTAERFIPDPFSAVPGRRLYKTGDLARYRSDGTIEYVGRLDYQVKIRGFRIEPGEIEAQLRQHPLVADALVIAWGEQANQKRLVAYVVPRPLEMLDASVLRQYLLDRLPAYMLPSFFVVVDALPRTVNGKVDRKALPAPALTTRSAGSLPHDLPQSKREAWLAQLWQEVLQIAEVGRRDNFFAIGGDSLIAMQLLTRLQRDFQVQLSLTDLFAAPTLAQLADRLQTATFQPADEPIVPTHQHDHTLAFGQQRLWFTDQLEEGTALFNVPLVLALTGPLNHLALYQALYEIIRRHQSLRTTIRVQQGKPYLHINEVAAPDLSIIDLPIAPENAALSAEEMWNEPEVMREMQAEVERPFDLASGPLLRIRLLHVWEDYHILMLTMHHIITDGWSLNLLTQELSQLYNAFLAGRPASLPEISLQYENFVAWQHTQQISRFAPGLAYWKECFTPLPAPLNLPTDHARPVVQTFAGAARHFRISQPLTRQLLAFSQQEGVTLFMTLLSVLLILLTRLSGQEDLVIGTPVANRPRPELEHLIGLFMNILALRVDLAGDPTGRELLRRVRAATLDAYNWQEIPFEKVIEAVQPRRDPARSPLFQVLFILQNTPAVPLNLEGLSARPIELLPLHSGYDLTFELKEHAQGLDLTIAYSTDLFEAATIERFYTYYLALLHELCTQPEAHIQSLPFLAEDEHARLVDTWKQTTAAFSTGPTEERIKAAPAEIQPAEHAPQGSVEETLAQIWQTVLGISWVERTGNFFEMGGHSLLAMQVLAAVREEFQVSLSVREFLAAPTLVKLASLITHKCVPRQLKAENALDTPPPLVPVARTGDLPLSFAQQRLWFLDQLEGSSATYNMPAVLQLTGPLNLPVFQQSLRELVRRHEVLRTTFTRTQQMSEPVQCIHQLPVAALRVIEIPDADSPQGKEALFQHIREEVQGVFDLATGPLLRLRLLRLNPQKHVLIFVMHHIISDGWSISIMARELSTLYNAFLAGQPSPLPELPVQYADFAAWQRVYLQGPRLDAHLAYWKQLLSGAPTLNLPTDRPRLPSATSPGAATSQQWSNQLTQQLLALSQREDVTLFMTLLTCFLLLLAYTSNQEDITIGTPIANRPHPKLEQLVGMFVNTLALRVNLAGNPTGRELLHRVREVTLGAYEHQDIPFEQVVEAVHPKREQGRPPLFQVLFVFQNVPPSDLSLTDLEVSTFDTHTSTAKFDLAVGLEMHEQGLNVGTEYNTHLFDQATIQRFHTHYRLLLEQFMAHLEWRLSDFYQVLSEHTEEGEKASCP